MCNIKFGKWIFLSTMQCVVRTDVCMTLLFAVKGEHPFEGRVEVVERRTLPFMIKAELARGQRFRPQESSRRG